MHNEKRQAWHVEGLYSLITGTVYGASSIIVGHPFDTIKTKMQAQTGFMGKSGVLDSVQKLWQTEGVHGFYRGALPPFFGSIVFRSLQFSVFESVYTYYENNKSMTHPIPGTLGLQPRVVLGGLIAALIRSVIENPFEYAKVKGQTRQIWHFRDMYKGFPTLCLRTTGLMTSFFIFVDCFRRNTNFYKSLPGHFILGGLSAVLAWTLIWPLENMKNVIQAGTQNVGESWKSKFQFIIKNYGILGLYRGMLPGLTGVFIRNGVAMVSMQYAIRQLSAKGYRP